ncbi:hypothetical protein N8J89_16445 [Crossiella sp. CA-258035]|uniref:hypothetical protein n=1 Tax=Crossiella sp. CA-258035 TaxID=2981138 RepID=UPI0024BCB2FE|nr:hypothetical protein [Crossiella sp. CA-258035]WHT22589.1 hypothetical protein N8J89_16445 [Crossiella sp. CA-258035]
MITSTLTGVLTFGLLAVPASARPDGTVPPECGGGFTATQTGSWAHCRTKYKFMASARCTNGGYYFGAMLPPGDIARSVALCPDGTRATNWWVVTGT